MKKFYETSSLSSMTVINALSILGNQALWPQILLGNCEYELRIVSYRTLYSELPKTEEQLNEPAVSENYNNILSMLRNKVQSWVDALTEIADSSLEEKTLEELKRDKGVISIREKREESFRLQKEGVNFIKNNTVDYGSETVAEIATRLNISKAEVRRRKQNNEL